jgi:hypothetical protein
MDELIEKAKDPKDGISLATFKPKSVIDFVWVECEREWDKEKLATIYAHQAQGNLFRETTKKLFQIAKKCRMNFHTDSQVKMEKYEN